MWASCQTSPPHRASLNRSTDMCPANSHSAEWNYRCSAFTYDSVMKICDCVFVHVSWRCISVSKPFFCMVLFWETLWGLCLYLVEVLPKAGQISEQSLVIQTGMNREQCPDKWITYLVGTHRACVLKLGNWQECVCIRKQLSSSCKHNLAGLIGA